LFTLQKAGSTGSTDRLGEFVEQRDIYDVQFVFKNGTVRFQFVDLAISSFDPQALDKMYILQPD
jgi:hypothetical protein